VAELQLAAEGWEPKGWVRVVKAKPPLAEPDPPCYYATDLRRTAE